MKNLILVLTLLLSFTGLSQINIEIFHPTEGYKAAVNDSSSICMSLSPDSTTFVIESKEGVKAYYIVQEIVTTEVKNGESSFEVLNLKLSENKSGFSEITIWKDMNLVLFEYTNDLVVLNSGQGVTYY